MICIKLRWRSRVICDDCRVKEKSYKKQLEEIFKVCKTYKVEPKEIKLGDLHIVLGESTKPPETITPQTRGVKRKARKITEQSGLQEDFEIVQEFTETLHLENPAEYERAIVEGELSEETVN